MYAKNSEIEWLGTCDGLLVVTWLLVVIFCVLLERRTVVSFLVLAQNRIITNIKQHRSHQFDQSSTNNV